MASLSKFGTLTVAFGLFVMVCGNKSSGAAYKPANINIADGLGFYPLNAGGVPAGVVGAANSVFIIRVIAAGSDQALHQVDVSSGKGRDAKAKIMALDSKSFDDMDKVVLIKQIEFCEGFKEIESQKTCLVSADIRASTGFLAFNGQTLWTTAHGIEGNMKFIEKYGNKSKLDQIRDKQRVGVFVFDRDHTLVVNPYVDEVHIKIGPPQTNVANLSGNFYAEDSDYFALSLAKEIGHPLKVSPKKIAIGDQVYVLGYPACTACDPIQYQTSEPEDFADRSPRPNSDGTSLRVSTGKVLIPSGLESFFGMKESSMELWRLDRMFLYNADSHEGDSGGPIVNQNGEVLAIHTGGMTRLINNQLQRISRSVLPEPFLTH